jgi:hypothetical protein
VIVGAYINDVQELDFKANNYIVDLYVWFRWTARDLDPAKTMEFMNRFASDDNLREALYDEPKGMPDGSLYSIIRYQGRFSTKFPLEKYPFDTQYLRVAMEDTVSADDKQIYVPDKDGGINLNPQITRPGFTVGKPACGSRRTPIQPISAILPSLRLPAIRGSRSPCRSHGRWWRCRSRPSCRSS